MNLVTTGLIVEVSATGFAHSAESPTGLFPMSRTKPGKSEAQTAPNGSEPTVSTFSDILALMIGAKPDLSALPSFQTQLPVATTIDATAIESVGNRPGIEPTRQLPNISAMTEVAVANANSNSPIAEADEIPAAQEPDLESRNLGVPNSFSSLDKPTSLERGLSPSCERDEVGDASNRTSHPSVYSNRFTEVEVPEVAVAPKPSFEIFQFAVESNASPESLPPLARDPSNSDRIERPSPENLDLESNDQTLDFRPPTQTTAHIVRTVDHVPRESLVDSLSAEVALEARTLASDSPREVHLRLDPPELGEVRVHLKLTEHGLSIRIVTPSDLVSKIIESQVDHLRQSLLDAGTSLNQCNVSSQSSSQQFDSNHSPPQPLEIQRGYRSSGTPFRRVSNKQSQPPTDRVDLLA